MRGKVTHLYRLCAQVDLSPHRHGTPGDYDKGKPYALAFVSKDPEGSFGWFDYDDSGNLNETRLFWASGRSVERQLEWNA